MIKETYFQKINAKSPFSLLFIVFIVGRYRKNDEKTVFLSQPLGGKNIILHRKSKIQKSKNIAAL